MTVRHFHTDMSAEEETKYTESGAHGTVDLAIDLSNLKITWHIVYQGLTSEPTTITLNGPAQPGANGIVMKDIGAHGMKTPLDGSATLNEAQVQFLLSRWSYVNVATKRYPKGEIRGQLAAVRNKDGQASAATKE